MGSGAAANNLYLPLCRYARVKYIFSSSGRSVRFAKYFNSQIVSDYKRILSDPEISFVVIANESNKHFDFTKAALLAGKHVLIEKPVVLNIEQAEEIDYLIKEKALKVGGIFQFRFLDVYKYAFRLVKDGVLGDIIGINGNLMWARDCKYYERHGSLELEGGGVMMVQAIHMIDLILGLGGEIKEAFLIKDTLKHNIEVEDTACCAISFTSGALGTIYATTAACFSKPFEIEVIGTRGSLAFNNANHFINWSLPVKRPFFIRKDLSSLQVKNFTDAIKNRDSLLVDFKSAAKTVKVILDLYRK